MYSSSMTGVHNKYKKKLIKNNSQVIMVDFKPPILTYFTSKFCSKQRKSMKGKFLVIVLPPSLYMKCSISKIWSTVPFARWRTKKDSVNIIVWNQYEYWDFQLSNYLAIINFSKVKKLSCKINIIFAKTKKQSLHCLLFFLTMEFWLFTLTWI